MMRACGFLRELRGQHTPCEHVDAIEATGSTGDNPIRELSCEPCSAAFH